MTYENRKTLWETVLRLKKREQCTFVICDDEKIVGFISGGPERTKRFAYDGEIYTIYILDEYQKKSLGAKLLKAFAQEMKGMRSEEHTSELQSRFDLVCRLLLEKKKKKKKKKNTYKRKYNKEI